MAVGLVVLMLLLNTSMLTGHSSTESVLSFPKNDIRDLRDQSVLEANTLAMQINGIRNIDNNTRINYYNDNFSNFSSSIKSIYLYKGDDVNSNVTSFNMTMANVTYGNGWDTMISAVVLNVSFYDGNTLYKENFSLNYYS